MQSLWHDIVNSAGAVHAVIQWNDDNISGVYGLSADSERRVILEKGWDKDADFKGWRLMRHNNTHVLLHRVTNLGLRKTSAFVFKSKDAKMDEVFVPDDLLFDSPPNDRDLSQIDQFIEGLDKAVRTWHNEKTAEANQEAEEWFKRSSMNRRKKEYPDRYPSHSLLVLCEPGVPGLREQAEKIIKTLTDDVRWGYTTTSQVAWYRYELKQVLRAYGISETRLKVERFNMDPTESDMEKLQWCMHIEAQMEALTKWFKESGGGRWMQDPSYNANPKRYKDILADECAAQCHHH